MTAQKKFLILQLRPEDHTSDNEFEAILRYGGIDPTHVDRIRIERTGIPDLNPKDYCAIIVGGSPFDISTPEDKKSDIQIKIEEDFCKLFDAIVPNDIPFLGCCAGSGLLGNYLSTSVSGKFSEPVGKATVSVTSEGFDDPLLKGFPKKFDVLLGHKEACDSLPRMATLLVKNEACPVQMYRLGKNVYATQFHPEGDGEGFALRIDAYRNSGYFPPESADRMIADVKEVDTPWGRLILRRFVERYQQ